MQSDCFLLPLLLTIANLMVDIIWCMAEQRLWIAKEPNWDILLKQKLVRIGKKWDWHIRHYCRGKVARLWIWGQKGKFDTIVWTECNQIVDENSQIDICVETNLQDYGWYSARIAHVPKCIVQCKAHVMPNGIFRIKAYQKVLPG